jgi:2-keto-4-pentenoate hydratase/2-oxohepta-3-ene-1,7-dioic acid hydratase in catechol pathway
MLFARYEAHGEIAYGVVEGNSVRQITTTPFDDYEVIDHVHALSEVRLLSPCTPAKIFYLGSNYADHTIDEVLKEPMVYLKMPNAIVGPGDTVMLPREATNVEQEAELVAVIGRRCKKVSEADALDCVLGYTCGNDISARDWQERDGRSFWRAKSSDTFAPIGPYIATDVDDSNTDIVARVNGREVQRINTSDMIFGVAASISYISQTVTLEPGDVLFTGTGGTNAVLHDGDVVEIEIPGIGTLSNPVAVE